MQLGWSAGSVQDAARESSGGDRQVRSCVLAVSAVLGSLRHRGILAKGLTEPDICFAETSMSLGRRKAGEGEGTFTHS